MRAGVFFFPDLLLQRFAAQTTPSLRYALECFVTIRGFTLLSAATTAVKYTIEIKI
jgi:hypothetical protein